METDLTLRVMIIFEDLETSYRAYETSRRLRQRVGERCVLNRYFWSFQEFNLVELWERATSEAAAADVMMLAMHGESELPPLLHRWFTERFPRRSQRSGAFVTLLEPMVETAVSRFIQDAAVQAGLTFFSDGEALLAQYRLRC